MHEIGHLFGMSGQTYRGVDSSEVAFEEYNSVMNYNSPNSGYFEYSVSKGFNDWKVIRWGIGINIDV